MFTTILHLRTAWLKAIEDMQVGSQPSLERKKYETLLPGRFILHKKWSQVSSPEIADSFIRGHITTHQLDTPIEFKKQSFLDKILRRNFTKHNPRTPESMFTRRQYLAKVDSRRSHVRNQILDFISGSTFLTESYQINKTEDNQIVEKKNYAFKDHHQLTLQTLSNHWIHYNLDLKWNYEKLNLKIPSAPVVMKKKPIPTDWLREWETVPGRDHDPSPIFGVVLEENMEISNEIPVTTEEVVMEEVKDTFEFSVQLPEEEETCEVVEVEKLEKDEEEEEKGDEGIPDIGKEQPPGGHSTKGELPLEAALLILRKFKSTLSN
eukprot:TRINITY_DN1416_c0_g2_i6.p1 TRINITY_DN1416_c0_g2~~TRINITY_DN1416_c0_g2_i6.p1  ORF type:complete len:321 (+),score=68.58 TRINITY_DN1416_c0_g2_i6:91-1053(+)